MPIGIIVTCADCGNELNVSVTEVLDQCYFEVSPCQTCLGDMMADYLDCQHTQRTNDLP